jgi:hypothetical protein
MWAVDVVEEPLMAWTRRRRRGQRPVVSSGVGGRGDVDELR